MTKPQSPASRGVNQILARLPDDEFARLLPLLKPAPLKFKQIVCEAQGRIEHVWFPQTGVLSAITMMRNGSAIEAANIGNEGLFGWTGMLASGTSPHRVIVQLEGEGLHVRIAVLKNEADRKGALYELMLLYNSAFLAQVSQSVACNGLHSAYQRCCRWLLMSRDRMQSDEMPLTHEFLAIMLGVRRAGVTEVLQSLKEAGLIHSQRGSITVLDRKGLEGAACECYRTVTDEYDRLFARFPLRNVRRPAASQATEISRGG